MERHMDPDETITSLPSLCKNTRPTKDWFWQAPMGIFHRLPHLQPGVKPVLMPAGKGEHWPTQTWANLAASKLARGSTSWELQGHPMTSLLIHLLGGLSSPAVIYLSRSNGVVNLAVTSAQSWAQSWSTPGMSLIQYLITKKPFPAPGSAGNGTRRGHNVLCLTQ